MASAVRVVDLFLIRERRKVLALLESFAWDFSLGKKVELQGSGVTLSARQTATGNQQGRAVVELEPMATWDEAVSIVAARRGGSIQLLPIGSDGADSGS
jgi:hypothetical protein